MLTSSLLIILAFISVLTRVLVLKGIPHQIVEIAMGLTENKMIIIALICAVILLAGMFVEAVTLTIIITPLFIPTAVHYGVDLVHFGSFMCVAIGIGSMTPPMAIALFVASRVGDVPVKDLVKPTSIFIIFGAIPVLLLTMYIPELSLWLPGVIMGP